MKDMRILVFGGRGYPHRDRVWAAIDLCVSGWDPQAVVIIEGDAEGADSHAKAWAKKYALLGVRLETYPADWKNTNAPGAVVRRGVYGLFNLRAGFYRNQRMIDEGKPTHALGFPGGSGTADMLSRIHAANRRGANIELRLHPMGSQE